jgi:hypothetical protein
MPSAAIEPPEVGALVGDRGGELTITLQSFLEG